MALIVSPSYKPVLIKPLSALYTYLHAIIFSAELDDVKKGLMVQRNQDHYIPLGLFRPWGHRVLSVTDLTSGMWCEVQVEYRHLHPHLKRTKEWTKMGEKGSPVVLKTATMKKGSEVHMKKGMQNLMLNFTLYCKMDIPVVCRIGGA